MIKEYKNYLIHQMEEEIKKITDIIGTDANIYYNFIDSELFGVVEGKTDTYFIVLNSYKDTTFRIEQNTTDYKRFRKWAIKDKIHSISYKKLVRRGLYMSLQSAFNTYDNYCDIQRLTYCLKENILGKVIHHKDSNPMNNNINNLIALYEDEHKDITDKNKKRRRQNEEYITL